MRCILISDPEADKSAASLDVKVGCSLDPKPLFGTAHFLEHMLF
jgi:secreted Zn-dependent insulinase-like peptidase